MCKLSGVRVTSSGEAKTTPDGREERGDRTAQALLAAARSAFSRGGYAAASVRDIARAAGVNPALVRYHFGSKEGLYRKVIDEAMSGLRTRLLAAFHQAGAPRERIHRVIGAYLDHLAQERDFPRLIQRALLNNDPHLRRVAHEYLHPLVDTLKPFVGRRVAGTLGSLEEVIVSVFGAIIAPFLYEPLLNDLFRRDVLSPAALKRRRRHIEALVEITLAQLLPETV
ncbi:TetR/AcrR family transcriptional regulator [Nannocystis exedens]|uniref:TetR/AcrR family transcriptional regulator n=1 Tax=Nannocystis exedens TaxID=54 RepID=UPI00117F0B40|nr:TetR/AcrR family transcriptional regulator [Nannocystis exedens]